MYPFDIIVTFVTSPPVDIIGAPFCGRFRARLVLTVVRRRMPFDVFSGIRLSMTYNYPNHVSLSRHY